MHLTITLRTYQLGQEEEEEGDFEDLEIRLCQNAFDHYTTDVPAGSGGGGGGGF
jgi:hypothetical protein